MNSKNIEAVILSRKDFGEADRLLTAFSLEEGKIKIIAKGSRKIKSKMAGHIEPFTVGKYHLINGKTFYILAGAEKGELNNGLSADINIYRDASYLCEIVDLTMQEGEANETIFRLLVDTLRIIGNFNEAKKEIIIRFFEFRLLKSLGYNPNFTKCLNCSSDITEKDVYHGGFEGVYCHPCEGEGQNIGKNTLKILRLFQRSELEDILSIKNIEAYNNDLKAVILPYFYDILPRKPKSPEL
ncbi:DNA repair protein RecO [Patescibacteria group bacterium]|nr:DNA repair protein RecO [Patescibacteria group bacterium]